MDPEESFTNDHGQDGGGRSALHEGSSDPNVSGMEEGRITLPDGSHFVPPLCACGCGDRREPPPSVKRSTAVLSRYFSDQPYILGHGSRASKIAKHNASCIPISEQELGRIYGTVLGDSSIMYAHPESTSPRLISNHSSKQQAYAEHKAGLLPSLQIKGRLSKNGGYGDYNWVSTSRTHPGLVEVLRVVRPMGGGIWVSNDWLERISDEGLCWWYMDDGSAHFSKAAGGRHHSNVHLHTEGYTEEECEVIRCWLKRKGFNTSLSAYRSFFAVRLSRQSGREFIELLRPWAAACMAYKFSPGLRSIPE